MVFLFICFFLGMARKSNLVPVSIKKFDPSKQLCRKKYHSSQGLFGNKNCKVKKLFNLETESQKYPQLKFLILHYVHIRHILICASQFQQIIHMHVLWLYVRCYMHVLWLYVRCYIHVLWLYVRCYIHVLWQYVRCYYELKQIFHFMILIVICSVFCSNRVLS